MRLPREFYARDTRVVARELIGKIVVRSEDGVRGVGSVGSVGGATRRGRIVETEAYHGASDAASHAHRGRTGRNAPMFGPPGHAYVYLIYGMWNCLNVVTCADGFPGAVLIRAVDLVEFDATAAARAGAGPGKLCAALGVDRRLTGSDLVLGDALWLEDDGVAPPPRRIARGPRIGVDYAGTCAARPWRFWWRDHPAVSRHR